MSLALDFGALLLIGAAWFFAAIGVALFFAALFQGAKYRDYDEPARDVDYDRAYTTLEDFRLARERKAERGHEAAQRARARRVI